MLKRAPIQAPEENQGKIRLTVCLTADTARALQHEAIDRRMTYGEIIAEALASRTILVRKGTAP